MYGHTVSRSAPLEHCDERPRKTGGVVEGTILPSKSVAPGGVPMSRKLLSFAVALSCVCGVGSLTPSASCAAEPAPKVARLGFVGSHTPSTAPRGVAAFWERLRELGWVKGENLTVEERWADGHVDRLPDLVNDVVRSKVDIIVTYNTAAAIAAKKATSTIPIVDAAMDDPVQVGLAASLAHPGGNLTGLSMGYGEGIPGKLLELLQDAVPDLSSVAVIVRPNYPTAQPFLKALSSSAQTRHLKLQIIEVRAPKNLDNAFEQARRQSRGVVVFPEPMTMAHRERVTALAAKYRLPTVYGLRDFVDAGGLMAYSPDLAVMFRRAADYVDRILKGAKPGDLPIEQPTQYQLVVNLKTAKALGITIPESILLRADEVIR